MPRHPDLMVPWILKAQAAMSGNSAGEPAKFQSEAQHQQYEQQHQQQQYSRRD